MAIRTYQESDRPWAESLLDEFGGPLQARRGELIDVLELPGFTAEREGRPVGLVTYRRENGECELAFIAVLERRHGIGSALLDALRQEVGDCERIWLVTTNDNLEALRFYQRRGFRLSALGAGAADESRRRLKTQISTVATSAFPSETRLSSNCDRSTRALASTNAPEKAPLQRPSNRLPHRQPQWAEPDVAQTTPSTLTRSVSDETRPISCRRRRRRER